MSLKTIKKLYPKVIDFVKVRVDDVDILYEHQIIERFKVSIFNSFEHLFESKNDSDKEIDTLKSNLEEKDK
jgi:hypothetical protein